MKRYYEYLLLFYCCLFLFGVGDIYACKKYVVTPQMFGAKADGKSDDTDAIVKANEALRAKGGVLLFPKGTYIVGKFAVYDANVGYGAINIHSNICYKGEKGSVIKVADGVNKSEFAWQGVFYERYLENTNNVEFENLTFDLNGQNNKYPYSHQYKKNSCCAAIRMLYPKNVKVIGCKIYNCPGLNCLPLGFVDGAIVENCEFWNSADAIEGNNIHDHSCILVSGENVVVRNNTFVNSNRSKVGTAIEVNASNSIITKNYVKFFKVGCLLSPTKPSSVVNVNVTNNNFEENRISFQIWHTEATTKVDKILFKNNIIKAFSPRTLGDYAIDIYNYAKFSITNLIIENNKIMQDVEADDGCYGGIILGENAKHIDIKQNIISGLTGSAISIINGASCVKVIENTITNCCNSTNPEANRVILVNGGKNPTQDISIQRNILRSNRKNIRGIWIINECPSLVVEKNSFEGFESYNQVDKALMKK